MDAMILAAGLGTRLGEIGRTTPKALIEVDGTTMLQRAARVLVHAGADRLIVNVHHHADRIAGFIATTDLGARTVVSVEADEPLETGGGLLHARSHFRGDAPFFLYNVDILTDADLAAMYSAHVASGALATLAVSDRDSTRKLLFDDDGLYGRIDERRELRIESRAPRGPTTAMAFGGFHVISPAFLDLLEERGRFSILDPYIRLSGAGWRIDPWPLGDAMWADIGTPERLRAVRDRAEESSPSE